MGSGDDVIRPICLLAIDGLRAKPKSPIATASGRLAFPEPASLRWNQLINGLLDRRATFF